MENITQRYRPKKFAQMIGQIPSVETVKSAINSGIIPPAYIAYGLQGCGKTSIATLIAMSLNCPNKDGIEPCGECRTCKAILSGHHDMFIELDAATNSGVGDMRDLMSSIQFAVPEGNYRVVVIDECHSLTKQAWQATLKTIERPPKRVLFVFCTTEYQSVPATIKSRCVQLQFSGVADATVESSIRNILKTEKVDYDEDAVSIITKNAMGSIRDAQSILEGFIRTGKVSASTVKAVYQTIDPNTMMSYFNAIKSNQIRQASTISSNWIRLGCSPQVIVNHLIEYLSNMIMDWNIKDKNIKSVMKTQREKLGEYQVNTWISTLTKFLSFIRNFPMAYSLLVNILTIKLYSDIEGIKYNSKNSDKAQKRERKEQEQELTGKTKSAAAPQPTSIDKDKAAKLQHLCGGTTISMDPQMTRLSFRHKNNKVIDIVSTKDVVENPYYILNKDLDVAIKDYPANMKSVIQKIN